MKKSFILPAAIVLCALLPRAAAADTWDDYHKLLDNYYLLDKQQASRVTCHLSVPVLDELLNSVKQGPAGKMLTVEENLRDFSVTYDRATGVSFVVPSLKVGFVPGIKLPDPAKAEQGRQMIEGGFGMAAGGVKDIISGLFDDMVSPDPAERKNLSLTTKNGSTLVAYDSAKSHAHVETMYSATQEATVETSPAMNITATSDYNPLQGKLAFAKGVMQGTQGPTKLDGNISVTYQDLKTISFPATIISDTNVVTGATHVTQHAEISFQNCTTGN